MKFYQPEDIGSDAWAEAIRVLPLDDQGLPAARDVLSPHMACGLVRVGGPGEVSLFAMLPATDVNSVSVVP